MQVFSLAASNLVEKFETSIREALQTLILMPSFAVVRACGLFDNTQVQFLLIFFDRPVEPNAGGGDFPFSNQKPVRLNESERVRHVGHNRFKSVSFFIYLQSRVVIVRAIFWIVFAGVIGIGSVQAGAPFCWVISSMGRCCSKTCGSHAEG